MNYLKKHILCTLKRSTGQHLIEYALLIILVMVGILVMGPYVMRSWNASVKGLEDSVQDSFQEPLTPAPPTLAVPECHCRMGPPCGTPPCCGFGGCDPTEDTLIQICDPVDCEAPVPAQCTVDANCCTTPVPLPNIPDDCGTHGCLSTELPAVYFCGNDPTPRYVCQYNPNCEFRCQGSAGTGDYHYKGICPFDNLGLTDNSINYTTVIAGNCSPPAGSTPKCEVECAPGFFPIFSNTACGCPPGTIEIGGKCTCTAGYILSTPGCQAGTCDQGVCGPRQCEEKSL